MTRLSGVKPGLPFLYFSKYFVVRKQVDYSRVVKVDLFYSAKRSTFSVVYIPVRPSHNDQSAYFIKAIDQAHILPLYRSFCDYEYPVALNYEISRLYTPPSRFSSKRKLFEKYRKQRDLSLVEAHKCVQEELNFRRSSATLELDDMVD